MYRFWRALLAVLSLSVTLVYGLPSGIERPGFTSPLALPFNATKLTSPITPSPADFETGVHWDTSVPLQPTAVYVTAIKLMYGLSQLPWSDTVDLQHSNLRTVEHSGYNAIIYTSDNPPSTGLTTGLVVRALYDVVTSMQTLQPGFYKVTSNMRLQGQNIGRIRITNINPVESSITSDRISSNQSAKADNLSTINGLPIDTTLLTSSGSIPDPSDSRFKVTYEYTGANIRSQDMFSAIFAGLANVAQYSDDGPCPWVTALSSSGSVVIHVGASPGQALFGWHISRTYYLLVYHLFLVQRVLKEMQFTLHYYGTPIAKGYMGSMLSVGGDGGVEGGASE